MANRAHIPEFGERSDRCREATLVDLLVVVSFLAIVAAVAVERLSPLRGGADGDAVRRDLLRALRTEERHRSATGMYASFKVTPGAGASGLQFRASPEVSVAARVAEGSVTIIGRHRSSGRSWCLNSRERVIVEAATC